jgi:hypothetical protein
MLHTPYPSACAAQHQALCTVVTCSDHGQYACDDGGTGAVLRMLERFTHLLDALCIIQGPIYDAKCCGARLLQANRATDRRKPPALAASAALC